MCTLFVGTASAQQGYTRTRTAFATTNPTADTLTNADTILHSTIAPAGEIKQVTIQVDLYKVSGTIAGKAIVYGSVNGFLYTPVDSVTFVDGATFTKVFSYAAGVYWKYRVITYESGTGVCLPKVTGLFKQAVLVNTKPG